MNVPIEPLMAKNFAPFGSVIECGLGEVIPINAGTCERHHALARIECATGRQPVLSIFRAEPRALPMSITMMERHPLGSQAFMPMPCEGSGEWLVVVARDRNGLPAAPRAFSARPDQGVSYNTNVWHHPLIALGSRRSFLVADAIGREPNLKEHIYPQPYMLEAP